jgi:hypothetical protein
VPKQHAKSATFVQVLEYMDGPQVVLLERGHDAKIIATAVELEGAVSPFFGSEISRDQWDRYRRGFVDLRYLFMYPKKKNWYIFDLAKVKQATVTLEKVEKNEFAENHYIPESGFFSYDHSEKIKEDEISHLATQKFKTDGIWDLPDFTRFYNQLTSIYAFFLSLKKFREPETRLDLKKLIKSSFSRPAFRGGSSYVNMSDGLLSIQELEDRLSVGKLHYASPGEVDVRGRQDVFAEIALSLGEFISRYDEIRERANKLHKYLSVNDLLRRDKDRFDSTGVIARQVLSDSRQLARSLGIERHDIDLIYQLSNHNSLIYAKILLWYFRRLEKYFMFFAEGRVHDPETIAAQQFK